MIDGCQYIKKLTKIFFKKWTPEMAYVLGFFAADGTMIINNRGAHFIEFHITDKEVLYKIKKVLHSDHKISVRVRKNIKHKLGYRLQIGSKKMFDDLSQLGFVPNKSLVMVFPDVPSNLLGDFVRGYFDGDGCVYFKKHFVKNRNKKKWIFTSRFTCGSKQFLKSLHTYLGPYVSGGFILKKTKSGFELVFSHRDSLALFNLMYHDTSRRLYLTRKYKLFSKAIKTLYGNN